MIFRRLASPIFFIALTTLLSLEYVGLHAQPTKTQLAQNLPPQTIVAKNTKKNKHSSTPVLVKNIRYHDHKKYTRIVFDLPTRAILKEYKKNNLAKIELGISQLSKRAFRKKSACKLFKYQNLSEKGFLLSEALNFFRF